MKLFWFAKYAITEVTTGANDTPVLKNFWGVLLFNSQFLCSMFWPQREDCYIMQNIHRVSIFAGSQSSQRRFPGICWRRSRCPVCAEHSHCDTKSIIIGRYAEGPIGYKAASMQKALVKRQKMGLEGGARLWTIIYITMSSSHRWQTCFSQFKFWTRI